MLLVPCSSKAERLDHNSIMELFSSREWPQAANVIVFVWLNMLSWVMSVSVCVCLVYDTIYNKPFSDTKHLCVMLYSTPCKINLSYLFMRDYYYGGNSEHVLSHGR